VSTAGPHRPVMLAEVLAALCPREGRIYVDATFGAGGYSTAVLEAAPCRVVAIDRDPSVAARAAELAARFPGRFSFVPGRFGDMRELLAEVLGRELVAVAGVVFDLGVSSPQLDDAERGFSFRRDGPLDMRMSRGEGPSARDLVNEAPEGELVRVLREFGEEPMARRIARAIVVARREAPIERTGRLAEVVRGALGGGGRHRPHDPATQTFQALRIAVNDELGELERALEAAEALLAPGGRLVVVSFHSLEDRRVKQFLAERSGSGPRPSRHRPDVPGRERARPRFRPLYGRALRPRADELAANPRARSARLRAAERLDAAAPREAAA
jgi:16S rRNA (cytosine1402-N4)-methyltransferase